MKNQLLQARLDPNVVYEKLWLAAKVIESTMEGIFVTDAEGDLQIVNPAFSNLTGHFPNEVLGTSPIFLASPILPTLNPETWEQIQQNPQWQGKLWLRRADGQSFLSWVTANTIFSEEEGGEPRHVLLFNDISENRQAEQEQEFFNEVTVLLNTASENPAVLQRIANLVISHGLAGCCLIHLCSAPTAAAAHAFSPHRKDLPPTPAAIQEVLSGKAAVVTRIDKNSLICLPITTGERLVGCLTLITEASDNMPYPAAPDTARELTRCIASALESGVMSRTIDQFRASLDATFDSIIMCRADTFRYTFVNQAALRLLGYTEKEMLTADITSMRPDFNAELFQKSVQPLLSGEVASLSYEAEFLHKNGRFITTEVVLQYIPSPGESGQYLAILRDVSERKRIEKEIEEMAFFDPLTKLPNRPHLVNQLSQRIDQAAVSGDILALLYIDLDRFKTINDTLGHEIGDKILSQVGARLARYVQDGELIARLGGDEFAIILSQIQELDEVSQAAEAILASLQSAFIVDGHELHITPSIGIGLYPQDGQDGPTLLQHAEVALYRAKHHGRNTYRYYTASLNAMALERLVLENSLRHALEREEFSIMYQPQVELEHGTIVGAEALVRWNHPDLGMIPPNDFIPLAEETGILSSIDNWVMLNACTEAATWPNSMYVSVNLSTQQIQQPDFAQRVAEVLRQSGLPPSRLELEMTENIIIENPELIIKTLHEIKALGVKLAIDDFGTGYSSLSHIKRMPLNILKIDQAFVRDCLTSVDDSAIITAIISMSHSLNLAVVAEGVESKEQLEFLLSLSCDRVQGYLFSKPVAAAKFQKLIREQPFKKSSTT